MASIMYTLSLTHWAIWLRGYQQVSRDAPFLEDVALQTVLSLNVGSLHVDR